FSATDALNWINAYRAAAGLRPVALDPRLMALAQAHSSRMAAADTLSHDVGGTLTQRLGAAGYPYVAAAENIAAGQRTLGDVLLGWQASLGHDLNMRDPSMTHIGIAAASNPSSA